MSKNRDYFEAITRKIDLLEHPELNNIPDSYGEVDGVSIIPLREVPKPQQAIEVNYQEISDQLPTIEPERIDGVISLYQEFNKTYGLKFDAEKINNISDTFKSIVDPKKKEIFEIYLREYIDRLRLACINQLGNTVYLLISKLTTEETIRSLTISERVALLDRLFEYMDKVNNMVTYLPKGDTDSELREIAQRSDEDELNDSSDKSTRNREAEKMILELLKNR